MKIRLFPFFEVTLVLRLTFSLILADPLMPGLENLNTAITNRDTNSTANSANRILLSLVVAFEDPGSGFTSLREEIS